MKSTRAGLVGGVAGAALSGAILVTVYEGKVLTASPKGELSLTAGEVARLQADRAPALIGGGELASSASAVRGSKAVPREIVATDRGEASTGSTSASTGQRSAEQMAKETAVLRDRVKDLERRLERADKSVSQTKMMDLTQEELRALAERCELRWDGPGLSSTPPKVSHVETLGLSKAEQASINEVLARYHKRVTGELSKIYLDATGENKLPDNLSPNALEQEIFDKSNQDELRRVFQQLSAERAGLRAASPPGSKQQPIEKLMRLLTTRGHWLEAELGKAIGPDLASRYRRVSDGFGSRSRSSSGCPK
jgi:cell division septum initiation protein DivIVA